MERSGSLGDLDLIVKFSPTIRAVIELKYSYNAVDEDHTLDKLAQNALKAIYAKQYGQEYRTPENTVIDIGMGVFGRGQVKVIFGDKGADG
jgi:hypothetical protein